MTETTTITATANDIYTLYGYHLFYSTARTTYNGTHSSTTHRIGQDLYSLSNYSYVYRPTFQFDLSSLSGATISVATLKVTGAEDYDDTSFTHYLYGYTQSSLTKDSDGFTAYGSTSFASKASSGYSTTTDGMQYSLNSSGVAYVEDKCGGNCIFMMRSSRDVGGNTPSGKEYQSVYSSEYATSAARPHLYLEYESSSSTWVPKIIMMFAPLKDDLLTWIRTWKPTPLWSLHAAPNGKGIY